MIFIFGSRNETKDLGSQGSKYCPICERDRPYRLLLQRTVSHLWFMFESESDKKYFRACEICMRGEQLTTAEVEVLFPTPPETPMQKHRLALVIGLSCITMICAVIAVAGNASRRNDLLAAPTKNDIYIVDLAGLLQRPGSLHTYGALRVRSVVGDRIEFDPPTVTYPDASAARRELRDGRMAAQGYFAPTPLTLTSDDMDRLRSSGAILSIERDQGALNQ